MDLYKSVWRQNLNLEDIKGVSLDDRTIKAEAYANSAWRNKLEATCVPDGAHSRLR